MSTEIEKIQIQIHLAEYAALRAEVLEVIKWRDNLVFISLGVSGTLFSFVFSQPLPDNTINTTRWMTLYLIAPLASIIGAQWIVYSWRIARIGSYLKELGKKVSQILSSSISAKSLVPDVSVLHWELSKQRLRHKWKHRTIEWIIHLFTFIVSGSLSQFLLLKNTKGSLLNRISSIEFPTFYIINWIMIFLVFSLFFVYWLMGFKNYIESDIHLAK